ncbi:hypothetical protein L596_025704 [Steinernema carpocapsae]|uniref:Uncharacterized protein n=1 Tax=Steinernema carpocapsae TaxID=34508 RepID=A0A4U5M8J0_STECR|nr:hypothetical protein L596_025704 [Steinernema carpocapsae]
MNGSKSAKNPKNKSNFEERSAEPTEPDRSRPPNESECAPSGVNFQTKTVATWRLKTRSQGNRGGTQRVSNAVYRQLGGDAARIGNVARSWEYYVDYVGSSPFWPFFSFQSSNTAQKLSCSHLTSLHSRPRPRKPVISNRIINIGPVSQTSGQSHLFL